MNDAHEQISHCLSRDKLRKLTMMSHMLAQTDLLSESKHFFVIFLNITTLSFYCHSFFWTQLLTVILLSHTQGLHILQWDSHSSWTQLISVTWTVNLFCHKHCHIITSNSHMTSLLCERNFKIERKSRKVNFLIVNNKKVNFSYWLSFLLLSQASYMFISTSSSSFFFRYLCSQFNT
jgi:hypothetical protein